MGEYDDRMMDDIRRLVREGAGSDTFVIDEDDGEWD